jgi:hypothetical protein
VKSSAFGGLAVLVAVLVGCYRYTPIELSSAPASEEVQIRISDPASARLLKELGIYTSRLDGRVSNEQRDSIPVSVTVRREYQGLSLESSQQLLYLSRGEIVEVRRRVLSRTRTVLASAGAVVIFAALVGTVVQLGDPNPPADDLPLPPPPGGIRLAIPIRLR